MLAMSFGMEIWYELRSAERDGIQKFVINDPSILKSIYIYIYIYEFLLEVIYEGVF